MYEFLRQRDEFVCEGDRVGVKYNSPKHAAAKTVRFSGRFRCGGCRYEWQNNFSWAQAQQECDECHSQCFPYQQDDLTADEIAASDFAIGKSIEELVQVVNKYLRTRPAFDSRTPLLYRCLVDKVANDNNVRASYSRIRNIKANFTFLQFLSERDEFVCEGDRVGVKYNTPKRLSQNNIRYSGRFRCGGCGFGWQNNISWVRSATAASRSVILIIKLITMMNIKELVKLRSLKSSIAQQCLSTCI
jgi:transposase-like protein